MKPVLGELARDAGLVSIVRDDSQISPYEFSRGKFASTWVLMAHRSADLSELASQPGWREIELVAQPALDRRLFQHHQHNPLELTENKIRESERETPGGAAYAPGLPSIPNCDCMDVRPENGKDDGGLLKPRSRFQAMPCLCASTLEKDSEGVNANKPGWRIHSPARDKSSG